MKPCIILIRPQMGENIGAVARAMSNFGLDELRIVAPRDGWPNAQAKSVAGAGGYVIDNAKIYDDFVSAMADIQRTYATTARPRDIIKPVLTPAEAMAEIVPPPLGGRLGGGHSCADGEDAPPPWPSPYRGVKVALVFGPERTGMENEDLLLCDVIVTIPTDEKNHSLNLAQSSVVMGYEWFKHAGCAAQSNTKKHTQYAAHTPEHIPAPREDMMGLFGQLEEYLDEVDYFRVAQKKPLMWQNLQNMLLRGQWTDQEVRTFRGMLRSLTRKF